MVWSGGAKFVEEKDVHLYCVNPTQPVSNRQIKKFLLFLATSIALSLLLMFHIVVATPGTHLFRKPTFKIGGW